MAKKGTSVRKRSSLLRATVGDTTGEGRVRESVRRDVAGTAEGGDDDDDDDDGAATGLRAVCMYAAISLQILVISVTRCALSLSR